VAAGRHPPPSELSHLILRLHNCRPSCKQSKYTHGYKYKYIIIVHSISVNYYHWFRDPDGLVTELTYTVYKQLAKQNHKLCRPHKILHLAGVVSICVPGGYLKPIRIHNNIIEKRSSVRLRIKDVDLLTRKIF